MRVSEYFRLGADQSSLDFVDIDVTDDVPVFVDPSALAKQQGDWAENCRRDLLTFFQTLLEGIAQEDRKLVKSLIFGLREPNETHMGVSMGESRGRGLGSRKLSDRLIKSLEDSVAVKSELLSDLEDTALFVPGVGRDIVSDMAVCIIRGRLIEYTQEMCAFYDIPLTHVVTPPVWDAEAKVWETDNVAELPRANDAQLLLVPRSIVRVSLTIDNGKYYRDFLRPYYEEEELSIPNSSLIRLLKDGSRQVYKTKLDKKLGLSKDAVAKNTLKHPLAFTEYKKKLPELIAPPLTGDQFADHLGTPRVDYQALLDEVLAIRPGPAGANPFHRAVSKLLTAVFESSLGNMRMEEPIHEGLKRIDITFDNIAETGFFRWLSLHYSAPKIIVECKNYEGDVSNPEVDQLAMRLAKDRGKVGILVYRYVKNRQRLISRCKAVARDGHGYILVLDDAALQELVDEACIEVSPTKRDRNNSLTVLRKQFEHLVMS